MNCGELENTVTVSAANEGTNRENNTSTATIVVNCPDITVEKVGNGPITAGQDAVFDITITNNGPGTATGVSLNDTVGAGWTITDQTGAACGIAAGVLSCSGIELDQGASYEIEITKTTSNANCGQIVNTVSVSAANENPQGTAPNTDSATIVVNCPDIQVAKTGNGTISAGQDAVFGIVIKNNVRHGDRRDLERHGRRRLDDHRSDGRGLRHHGRRAHLLGDHARAERDLRDRDHEDDLERELR